MFRVIWEMNKKEILNWYKEEFEKINREISNFKQRIWRKNSSRYTNYDMIAESHPNVKNTINKTIDKFNNVEILGTTRKDKKWD